MECSVCFTTNATVEIRPCSINASCRPLMCTECNVQNARLNQGRCLNGCREELEVIEVNGWVIEYIESDGEQPQLFINASIPTRYHSLEFTLFDNEEDAGYWSMRLTEAMEAAGRSIWQLEICAYTHVIGI